MRRVHYGWGITAALLISACATTQPAPPPPPPAPAAQAPAVEPTPVVSGTLGEKAVTATAKVKKVDLKKRLVTLEGADGETEVVECGPEVRNLPQLKAGDEVNITYYESVAFEVNRAGTGEPGVAVAGKAMRAEEGQKPGAAGARVITITATIAKIDKKHGTATLTMPDGSQETVKARNPANLDKVQVGDLVDITMTQALAIAVEPKK